MKNSVNFIELSEHTYWNYKSRTLIYNHSPVNLSQSMGVCLELLILNMPRSVHSSDLFNAIWDSYEKEYSAKSIRTLISKLRKALPQLTIMNHYGGSYSLAYPKATYSHSQEIIDSIDKSVYIFNADKSLLMMNKHATKKVSYTKNAMCYDVLRNGNKSCMENNPLCPIEYVINNKRAVNLTKELIDKNGHAKKVAIHISPLFKDTDSVQEVMFTMHEPSIYLNTTKKLVTKVKSLTYDALHDPLTGLANRKLLLDRVHQVIKRNMRTKQTFAIFFLDLDLFKNINDEYGHATGDELLKEIAQRLQKNVRASDTVARLSGDEFVLIIEDGTSYKHFEDVAKKILLIFDEAFYLNKAIIHLTASIGISLFPKDATNVDTLLSMADEAMYSAKRTGQNKFSFYEASKIPQQYS